MTKPVSACGFTIDGEVNVTTARLAGRAQTPVPLRGQMYTFEGVEYLVMASEMDYNSNDCDSNDHTSVRSLEVGRQSRRRRAH